MEEKRISFSSSRSLSVSPPPSCEPCNTRERVREFLSQTHPSGNQVDDLGKVVGEAENVKGECRTEKREEMRDFVKFQHPLGCGVRMLETKGFNFCPKG